MKRYHRRFVSLDHDEVQAIVEGKFSYFLLEILQVLRSQKQRQEDHQTVCPHVYISEVSRFARRAKCARLAENAGYRPLTHARLGIGAGATTEPKGLVL